MNHRCFLILLGSIAFSVARGATFYQLGFLGQDGPSLAYAISGDGNTVVGESNSEPGFQAFRWTRAAGMVGLGDFPGGFFSSSANAVNFNGTIIVGGSDDGGAAEEGAGFKWTSSTGLVHLGNLGGPSTYSPAYGLSNDGNTIVGISQNPSWNTEAFYWLRGHMYGLGYLHPGSDFSKATDVTPDGRVVVGYAPGGYYYQAFVWTKKSGLQLIHPEFEVALAISNDGITIVGQSEGTACMFHKGVLEHLFTTTQGTSWASACSAKGDVIVGIANYDAYNNSGDAFIWDPLHGKRLVSELAASIGVDLHGFHMMEATGVSDDGKVICGWGFSQTDQEAWVLDLR